MKNHYFSYWVLLFESDIGLDYSVEKQNSY